MRGLIRRLDSLLVGDEPAAIEALLGQERWHDAIWRIGAMWMAGAAVGSLGAALIADGRVAGVDSRPILVVSVSVLMLAAFAAVRARYWPPHWYHVPALIGAVLAVLVIAAAGGGMGESTSFIPAFSIAMFGFSTRRGGAVFSTILLVGYAVMVSTVAGFPAPAARVLIVAVLSACSCVLVHWMVTRVQRLAASERAAAAEVDRLAAALATANARLQRYVAPQVAAVVAEDATDFLDPHRAEVSVLFVDLRGFTAFTVANDPAAVVEVLAEYYAVIGQLVEARGATLARFAGDGIMAYFGDPTPCDDPAAQAVALALEFRAPMAILRERWDAQDFRLGYGVGIGTGPATLGSVGFEERRDYTALGPVVNLAARLCAEALDGEILIDGVTAEATDVPTTSRKLDLKGLPAPVVAHVVESPNS